MTSDTAEVLSVNQRTNQTEKSDRDNKQVKLAYTQLILCATGIGIAGGLVATS
ncbi:MAG: chloride channel protein, partial [Moorea sp. SIO3I7]|nr:chloride channel protein [Moorena sp. SIO3I7]